MDRKYDVITLGEILLRLSTPINGRLAQGDTLMKHLGGAELNIASEIGQLGLKTAMISKIPNNLLAAFIKNQMNASRVSENYLISDTADDSRIGVYYYEYGSYPRKPRVVYDRKHSSINNIDIKDVPETMFYNTRLFHTSGITLGLGGNAQKFAIECIRKFKEQGTLISFDVNYRANLWTGEEARACIEQILPYVDIFFCSEDTARLTFGKTGTIEEIQKSFCEEYPISVVASTERTVITPKKHNFTSIIYSAKNTVSKPKSTNPKKVKAAKKAISVTWKKVSGVKGYQIQVATDKKFKKNKKTVTIKKQKTTKTTVKKLKAKKKYYVRIRTYKIVNGKKVYSSWSKVKSVKTK